MQVYGHRGAAGEAPENTIAGCLHAIDRGVERIEIDLQFASDGNIVIVHDTTVDRTTLSTGNVVIHNSKALRVMDARQYGPRWAGKRDIGIPTLDALLAATSTLKKYQLEVKPGNKRTMRRMAEQLAERFPANKKSERFIITSSNTNVLQYVAELAPHLERGMVATKREHLKTATALKLDYFCCHWTLCSTAYVKKAQLAGMHVSCWTVNEPMVIKKLYAMNVDSIISDYPSMALPLVSHLQR